MVSHPRATLRADRLRALNLPHPVRVEVDEAGQPTAVRDGPSAPAAVETLLEYWRIDDEWWRDPISRRYADVVLQGGKHVVLYQDLLTGDWFMQRP